MEAEADLRTIQVLLGHAQIQTTARYLCLFGGLRPLKNPTDFDRFLRQLGSRNWVVYARRPFGGPQHVVKYLARYTHRVAISNGRLIGLQDGQVTFRWRDSANGNPQKMMTVDAVEFLRRFLLHVWPSGFVKIRHFGCLANRNRRDALVLCRTRLLATAQQDGPVDLQKPASSDDALYVTSAPCGLSKGSLPTTSSAGGWS